MNSKPAKPGTKPGTPINDCLISLQNIRCRLDRTHQFQQLNWQIMGGQQWAVLGRNGAGKTALARLVAHQLPIASGRLDYADGFEPGRDIAWVSFELQKALCERDQHLDMSELSEAAFDKGTSARQAILRGKPEPGNFNSLCRRYGVAPLLETGIRYLSSGEMRKIIILRGLLQGARLLVLDDPLEGLDRNSRREVAEMLEQAMDNGQQTLLLTRRKKDLLRPVSHILLIEGLHIAASGCRDAIEDSDAWRQLFPPLPELPASLPPALPGRPRTVAEPQVPLIEAHDICASYQGKTVLQGIELTVQRGQQTAISGPNGCGKSTLLNLVCGENHKAYGQNLKLFGRLRGSGETLWQVKSRFGVVSNQVQAKYIRGWSALEVVISGLHDSIGLYESYGAAEEKAARRWLQALQLGDLAGELFHALSFGQQRVVLLARAMIAYPPILVLDEPCTGLDDYNREWVLRLVDHIVDLTDTHILYVTHLADELPRCINRELEFILRGDGYYQLRDR